MQFKKTSVIESHILGIIINKPVAKSMFLYNLTSGQTSSHTCLTRCTYVHIGRPHTRTRVPVTQTATKKSESETMAHSLLSINLESKIKL